jgi:hypothetical protein
MAKTEVKKDELTKAKETIAALEKENLEKGTAEINEILNKRGLVITTNAIVIVNGQPIKPVVKNAK